MDTIIQHLKKVSNNTCKPQNTLSAAELCFMLFFVGSVIGWIYELIFYLVMEHRLTNSGFFYGPYLPIYGFGALFILLSTRRFKKYPAAVFLITVPVTGILEYATGFLMYSIWGKRWWDYRGLFLNIDGYVCLRSVFSFAVGAVMLDYLVEPAVRLLICKMSSRLRNTVIGAAVLILLCDTVFTVLFRVPKL